MATFGQASRSVWDNVARVSGGAAVFLDGKAAELLHWAGGVRMLGECVGAFDLYRELSAVAVDSIAAAPYCHVVMVVTSFLHGVCSERVASLLSALQPLQCHVFCSRSEQMHREWLPMPEEGEEEEGGVAFSHFGEFQALMRKWISRQSGVRVSVNHLPLFHCEVCPGFLLAPPFSSLFPLLPSDLTAIQMKLIEEGDVDCSLEHLGQVEFAMLSHWLQTEIRCFVSALSDLLGQLEVREEVFSLGQTSRLIAHQLAGLPSARARRKSASQRASVVIVDRSLDLSSPCSHTVDSLSDRLFSLLPRLPQHSADVAVDLSPISPSPREALLPGCLAQPGNNRAQSLLKTLVCSRQKEALMEVSRSVLDALSQERLSGKVVGRPGRPSAAQLRTFLEQFKSQAGACVSQAGVLQVACAVVQTLENDGYSHWEELAGIEKVLQFGVRDSSSLSVTTQLTTLTHQQLEGREGGAAVSPEGKRGGAAICLEELLSLAVLMQSMVGEECSDHGSEEKEFKEALADLALTHRPCDEEFLTVLGIGPAHTRELVLERLSAVMGVLSGLGETRLQLKQFRDTLTDDHTFHPLLVQLMEAILSPSRPDLPSLEHHSQGVTDILKSGFSLFMSSARPRPGAQPLLLLCVVGGVSANEVRLVRDIASSLHSDTEVVVVGTNLLTPTETVKKVLCSPQYRL